MHLVRANYVIFVPKSRTQVAGGGRACGKYANAFKPRNLAFVLFVRRQHVHACARVRTRQALSGVYYYAQQIVASKNSCSNTLGMCAPVCLLSSRPQCHVISSRTHIARPQITPPHALSLFLQRVCYVYCANFGINYVYECVYGGARRRARTVAHDSTSLVSAYDIR